MAKTGGPAMAKTNGLPMAKTNEPVKAYNVEKNTYMWYN